jgi:transcriptional regulator with XRE-family HTH domain
MDKERGARLKQAREAKGWTTADLARATGVNYQTVWNHEQGEGIAQRVLHKYADALQVTEGWLQYGVGGGPGGVGVEIVEEYLSSDLGKTTPPWLRTLLRQVSYPSLGVRKPTLESVHRVRDLIEINRHLERQPTNARGRKPARKQSR